MGLSLMRYGRSNVILDASICDDEVMGGVVQRHDSHIIELTNLGFEIAVVAFATWIKQKATRKDVNNSTTRGKLRVKRIERRKDLVELIVHVHNGAFD